MKKIFVFIGILLFTSNLMAQKKETVFGYSGLKLTGIYGGLAFSLSGIGESNVYYRGGFGGLEFNKSIYISYAAYWLNDEAELSQFPDQKIDMRYKGLLLGYAIKPSKIVHPKISLLTAWGKVDVQNQEADKIFVLQPAAGIEINIFKWWHVDVLGGYRMVTGADLDGLSDKDVSAPFGEIRLRFGLSWGWF